MINFNSKKVIFLIFLLIVHSTILNAQKVGLVLSGGGARGLAHIGVIKALEENNIPIDYISGTSMGAIVGALYSVGYSPAEMENLVTSKKFLKWVYGEVDKKSQYYFKKEEENAGWMHVPFSWDSIQILQLPTNIRSGHQLDFAFMELFSQAIAKANYDFDSLFVPFRCVASDIYANKAVIFKEGDLATAIRASMTFPFFYQPLNIDGNLLYDGGIYNNFPVDVMEEEFQPDIIIGSKVVGNYAPPKADNIFLQIVNLVMGTTNWELPEGRSVLIEPSVRGFSLMDFTNSSHLIDSGYISTIRKMNELNDAIERISKKEDIDSSRYEFIRDFPKLLFDNIYIENLNEPQTIYVTKSIKHKQNTINQDFLKREYFKLLADPKISSIYPRAKYNKSTGYFDLFLDVKPENHFEIEVGGNISSHNINQFYLGVDYKYLGRSGYNVKWNLYTGRFYNSAKINTRIDFPGKLPFFINTGIVYNRWDYYKGSQDLFFEDLRPSYVIQNEANLKVSAGFPTTANGKFVIGGGIANTIDVYYQTKRFSKLDTADKTDFYFYTLDATFETNDLNYKQYANSGSHFKLQARYIGGSERHRPGSTSIIKDSIKTYHTWFTAKFIADDYVNLSDNFTFGLYFEAVYSAQPFFHNYTSSIIAAPSFNPTPQSKTLFIEKYRAHTYAAAGIKAIFHLFRKKLDFRIEGYVFQPYKPIQRNPDNKKAEYGSIFEEKSILLNSALVYHSPIGPMSLSFNYYDREDNSTYVLFNIGYILFNKRAID